MPREKKKLRGIGRPPLSDTHETVRMGFTTTEDVASALREEAKRRGIKNLSLLFREMAELLLKSGATPDRSESTQSDDKKAS